MQERRKIETQATALQDRLSAFALLDAAEQGPKLKELLDLIKGTATREVVTQLVDKEFQARLTIAASGTAEDPIVVDGGLHLSHPWTNYTLVALDSNGGVRAAVSQSSLNEEDKYKFALAKVTCFLHLEKAGMSGGLGKRKNLDYLAILGVEPLKDVFMGSAQEPVLIGDESFYLGAGGCEINNYRAIFLGLDLSAFDGAWLAYHSRDGSIHKALRNTQAGEIDNAFCDEVAMRLANPNLPITPHEPKRLHRIRLRN